MRRTWPSKTEEQELQLNMFLEAYRKLPNGGDLELADDRSVEDRDQPDFFVKDTETPQMYGVEMTSVYSDDRSVPDKHMVEANGMEDVPFDPAALRQ